MNFPFLQFLHCRFFQIFTITVILLQAEAWNKVGKHVSWVELDHAGEAISRMPEPAGVENGLTTFLCRAIYGGEWKPGSLIVRNGEIYCNIEYYGARKLQSFQMLDLPRGTTSWVPYTDTLPTGAIIGGYHGSGEYAIACRALIGSNIYIGSLSHKLKLCHIAIGNTRNVTSSNLEVLSVNSYGTVLVSSKNTCKQVLKKSS